MHEYAFRRSAAHSRSCRDGPGQLVVRRCPRSSLSRQQAEARNEVGVYVCEVGVYVCALPHYIRHPYDQASGRTLLKVGHSHSDVIVRFRNQIRTTALPEEPILLRIYRTNGDSGGAEGTTQLAMTLVFARRMSALADDPADFSRWAKSSGILHDGFLPRAVYGRYLHEVLASAERAADAEARVTRLSAHVVGLDSARQPEPFSLRLAGGGHIEADAVVLATGHRPPGPPPWPVPATGRYVPDPWAPDALDKITDGSPVVIVGTGLTMIDIAITVTGASKNAVVYAVSRHGLLPRAHPAVAHSPGPDDLRGLPGAGPVSLAKLIRAVRTAAAEGPDGWEAAVDAVRRHAPQLWQGLSPSDRRLFLRHVAPYWEIHRHRTPPATARQIQQLISDGRLAVLSGQVAQVDEAPGGMLITIDDRPDQIVLGAGWIVNATGPAGQISASRDLLLRELLTNGLAAHDPLGLGITADADGAVLDANGQASDRLFTLGPPLHGQLYETTTIPEIREQAARLAKRIVSSGSVAVAA